MNSSFKLSAVAAAVFLAANVGAQSGALKTSSGPQSAAAGECHAKVLVPAQYESLSQQVKISESSTEWRSVLCENSAAEAKIMEIQRALATAGFEPGPIDGVIHDKTMRALNAYQSAKGLPVDSYLNLQTVKALGVKPN